MRDKLGYMFGDFGNDFTFILQMMFFMLFYTNVVGIKPGHIGLLFLLARLVDGFTDVGMGIIVDRLRVKPGGNKFKRWIKLIAIPVAVASALMYMSFVADWESYTARLIWMVATYFLWGSVTYTAINIPYGSMASVISSDPDHRAQLSVFRSTGANLAMLVIQAALLLLLGNLFLSGMLGYTFLSYFGNGKLQSAAAMAALLPTFTLVVLAPMLAKRFGKAETGGVAMVIAGATLLVALLLRTENAVLWIVLYAIASFCVAVFNFLVWAFITDVIDFQDVRTGQRDDATVYALYSWARKVGQALAGGLTGAALGWIGFSVEDAKAGKPQPEAVVGSIYTLVNAIPGVAFILVGVVLIFLYPLKKGVIAKNVEILAARRAGTWAAGDPMAPKDQFVS